MLLIPMRNSRDGGDSPDKISRKSFDSKNNSFQTSRMNNYSQSFIEDHKNYAMLEEIKEEEVLFNKRKEKTN